MQSKRTLRSVYSMYECLTVAFIENVIFCKNGLFFLSPQAMESGPSRSSTSYKRPVRTQAVIDQSDMYTHVLSDFTEKKVNEDCILFQNAIVCLFFP